MLTFYLFSEMYSFSRMGAGIFVASVSFLWQHLENKSAMAETCLISTTMKSVAKRNVLHRQFLIMHKWKY